MAAINMQLKRQNKMIHGEEMKCCLVAAMNVMAIG